MGALKLVSSSTLSSDTGSVTLTGINSTYDCYYLTFNNATPDTADADFQFRFTESGTPNTTSNYDYAIQYLRSDTNFVSDTVGTTNSDKLFLSGSMENDANVGGCNGFMYIFNATDSSEFTFATLESIYLAEDGTMLAQVAGLTFTVNSSVDGVNFFFDSGNIRSGAKFVLYGLQK
tara:strand:- start:5627 stop:6154 length:528 start_codon:yes stop_codon:yes gene_type:complete